MQCLAVRPLKTSATIDAYLRFFGQYIGNLRRLAILCRQPYRGRFHHRLRFGSVIGHDGLGVIVSLPSKFVTIALLLWM